MSVKIETSLLNHNGLTCIIVCVYLIDISQMAVDVLAEFEQQAYRTLIENVQVEEK